MSKTLSTTSVPYAQIQEWKRLADAASDGPWTVGSGYEQGDPGYCVVSEATHNIVVSDDGLRLADQDFIAAARTAVPELIAEVERLSGKVQQIRDMITALHRNCEESEQAWRTMYESKQPGERLRVDALNASTSWNERKQMCAVILARIDELEQGPAHQPSCSVDDHGGLYL